MDKFDEKIIGYEATKNILRQILDTLKRPELYKSKGASIPRGLLMESDPGLGKSLLATVFIKESGRKSYGLDLKANPLGKMLVTGFGPVVNHFMNPMGEELSWYKIQFYTPGKLVIEREK